MVETSDTQGAENMAWVWHGTPTCSSWASMLARVRGTAGPRSIRDYKDRGITVCKRWLVFKNFLTDMGPRPAGKTLDRKNNDGNYTKRNCRWATRAEQNTNRRPYNVLKVRGVRYRRNRYQVQVCWKGWTHHAGCFHSLEEAKTAYHRKLTQLKRKEQRTNG